MGLSAARAAPVRKENEINVAISNMATLFFFIWHVLLSYRVNNLQNTLADCRNTPPFFFVSIPQPFAADFLINNKKTSVFWWITLQLTDP
jgi:hypothetical protein